MLDTNSSFDLFRDKADHWCARRLDGLVFGMFREREDALRFCQRKRQRQFSATAP